MKRIESTNDFVVKFANVNAQGILSGSIEYAQDWQMQNVTLHTDDGIEVKISESKNVAAPKVLKRN